MTIQAYRRDYAWTRAEKRNVTFPAEEPQPQGGPRRRSNIHDLTLQTGGRKAQRPPLAWNEWIFTNGQVLYFGKTPQRAIQGMATCGPGTGKMPVLNSSPPLRAIWRNGNLWLRFREITQVLGATSRCGALGSLHAGLRQSPLSLPESREWTTVSRPLTLGNEVQHE